MADKYIFEFGAIQCKKNVHYADSPCILDDAEWNAGEIERAHVSDFVRALNAPRKIWSWPLFSTKVYLIFTFDFWFNGEP